MSYIDASASTMKLEGYIGDDPKDLRLQLYADADFASDLTTRKKYEWVVPCFGRTPYFLSVDSS